MLKRCLASVVFMCLSFSLVKAQTNSPVKSVRPVTPVRAQPSFNSWVGTSVGVFAQGKPADFDFFICKDGRSALPAISYNTYYGMETVTTANGKMVINNSEYGGWMMYSGVDLGTEAMPSRKMEIEFSTDRNTSLEVFLDSLDSEKPHAIITVPSTEGKLIKQSIDIGKSRGQHDVFIRFARGSSRAGIYARSAFLQSDEVS